MIHVASDYTSKLLVQLKISKHIEFNKGVFVFPGPPVLCLSPAVALAPNLYLPALASNLDFLALTKNNSFSDPCP